MKKGERERKRKGERQRKVESMNERIMALWLRESLAAPGT